MSWFESQDLGNGVVVIRDPGYARPSLAYLVTGEERAALIDAGLGMGDLRAFVAGLTDLPVVVLQTHAHPDHAGGSHQFDRVLAHPRGMDKLKSGWRHMELRFEIERFLTDRVLPPGVNRDTFEIPGCATVEPLEDRGVVDLGGRQLDVFFTPGHSPDSVCFLDLERGQLFTGDSILKGRIAVEDMIRFRRSLETIKKLAELAAALYPAHGETPIEPGFVERVRHGLADALAGRHPSGFLAGFATFEFEDFGLMLPPRHRRARDL